MRPVQIIQLLDFRELVETALERLVVQRNRIKSAVLARWRGGQAFNQVPVRVEREVVKIELGFSQIVIGLLGIQYIVYRIDRRYRRVQLREAGAQLINALHVATQLRNGGSLLSEPFGITQLPQNPGLLVAQLQIFRLLADRLCQRVTRFGKTSVGNIQLNAGHVVLRLICHGRRCHAGGSRCNAAAGLGSGDIGGHLARRRNHRLAGWLAAHTGHHPTDQKRQQCQQYRPPGKRRIGLLARNRLLGGHTAGLRIITAGRRDGIATVTTAQRTACLALTGSGFLRLTGRMQHIQLGLQRGDLTITAVKLAQQRVEPPLKFIQSGCEHGGLGFGVTDRIFVDGQTALSLPGIRLALRSHRLGSIVNHLVSDLRRPAIACWSCGWRWRRFRRCLRGSLRSRSRTNRYAQLPRRRQDQRLADLESIDIAANEGLLIKRMDGSHCGLNRNTRSGTTAFCNGPQ